MNNKLINITGVDVFIFYGLLLGGLGFVLTPTPENDVLWTAILGFVSMLSSLIFFTFVWLYSRHKRQNIRANNSSPKESLKDE